MFNFRIHAFISYNLCFDFIYKCMQRTVNRHLWYKYNLCCQLDESIAKTEWFKLPLVNMISCMFKCKHLCFFSV